MGRSAVGQFEEDRHVLGEEVMHALAPSVDVLLTQASGPSNPRFSPSALVNATFECFEMARKKRESAFAFGGYMHPSQEADGAEEARGLDWGAESSEEMT